MFANLRPLSTSSIRIRSSTVLCLLRDLRDLLLAAEIRGRPAVRKGAVVVQLDSTVCKGAVVVQLGSTVRKGEVVVQLDSRSFGKS